MCIYKDCNKSPNSNYPYETKSIYCSTHRLEGMVDIKHKKCINENCNKIPSFNHPHEKRGIYCNSHKLEGMINIVDKRCQHTHCDKRPHHNYPHEKNPIYCVEHKLEGMVDVKSKRCQNTYCDKRPSFNYPHEKKALYCNSHKLEGMVDIKHKKCQHTHCDKRPHHNYPHEKIGIYCSEHKLEGMVDVLSKRCKHESCNIIPSFNYPHEKGGLYCVSHKLEGMVDNVNVTCKSEWCVTQPKKKYDGYCIHCYMNLFPDKPVSRNYKTKEYSVVEYVKSYYPDLSWNTDIVIHNGCSKRRPDIMIDLGYQILIIEIDENKHTDYDCSCENKRVMELSQDVGHRPIIFIRFNPDDYQDNGKKISSCWGNNKQGICLVKKTKKNEWNERLNVLKNNIEYWLDPNNITNKTVETIQLFYDK